MVERLDSAAPGWADLLHGRNGLRSLALAGGVALHAVNVYLVITILPSVVRDIGGLDFYAWNTTLFAAASIIGSVLASDLFQRVGARPAYAIAAAIFGIGALICGSAPTMVVLLLGRTIQGAGGGLLFAMAYTMIRLAFPEPLWPRAMALVSSMWGIATLLGPALGGLFANHNAWRTAFWSLAPITLAFGTLAYRVLPATGPDKSSLRRPPVAQLALIVLAVLSVSAGSVSGDLVWGSVGLGVSVICIGALILRERHARSRVLPTSVFRERSVLATHYLMIALLNAIVTASEIFVPLFVQVLHRQSPLIGGYYAAAMAAGWTIGSLVTSGVAQPTVRRVIFAAPVIAMIAMGCLALTLPMPSLGALSTMAPIGLALVAVGFGVGIAWPHLLSGVLKYAPDHEQNLASGGITTVQLFATAMAAAIAGLVANATGLLDPSPAGTSRAAFALLSVCTGLALIAAAIGGRLLRVLTNPALLRAGQ